MATLVRFLKKDNEIYAFFPQLNDVKYRKDLKLSYSHIGQHSPCSIEYAKESTQATKEEYTSLLNELKQVGYTDLRVLNRD